MGHRAVSHFHFVPSATELASREIEHAGFDLCRGQAHGVAREVSDSACGCGLAIGRPRGGVGYYPHAGPNPPPAPPPRLEPSWCRILGPSPHVRKPRWRSRLDGGSPPLYCATPYECCRCPGCCSRYRCRAFAPAAFLSRAAAATPPKPWPAPTSLSPGCSPA